MNNILKRLIKEEIQKVAEKWSSKYKRKIDCNNPKGFSQKAHCQGRKKRQEHKPTKSKSPFLNEIKAIDAYNQYYKGLVDKDNQEKDLSIYNEIVRLDPTFIDNTENLGQYTKWLFRKDNLTWILINFKTHQGEDLYKIKEALTIYEKAKRTNNLPIDKKDIGKFNIDTLFDLTFELQNQNLQSNTEKEKEVKEGAEKVFENSEWVIIVPETEEAACYYGKGTKWCTAGNINNRFDYYNRQGTLYILINKDNPSEKFQFHFESGQFMDKMDRDIDLSDFFNDYEEVYDFFLEEQGSDLTFQLCEKALERGDTEGFESFYDKTFNDEQKRRLIVAAFEGDQHSDGYYTVSQALNYINYPGMENDFKRDFLYAFENSIESSYDDENYDAKMFLSYLGGITQENYDDIFRQVDFKDYDEIQKIFEIIQDFDNGNEFLSRYIQEEEIDINHDLLDTIDYLKTKFYYSERNNLFASKLAQVRIRKITDFQQGLVEIEFTPKDEEGNTLRDKTLKGNVNYKNIIKYLTIPQIPLNESKSPFNENLLYSVIKRLLKESDEDHYKTLTQTGFWGKQGAGCIVLSKSSKRFLLPLRSSYVQEPNTWGVWGGAIDSNEDPKNAAKRELTEEAGYHGEVQMIPLSVFQKDSFKYFNFLAIVDDEFTPRLNWETQTFTWTTLDDLPQPLHFGLKWLLSQDLERLINIVENI